MCYNLPVLHSFKWLIGRDFLGEEGLRQREVSNLFVLAMTIYSRLMEEYSVKSVYFEFHYRCSKTRLTHLCFADDLLIFSEASLNSVHL